MFKKEVEKDIAGDTSGDFAKLLLALVQVAQMLTKHRYKMSLVGVLEGVLLKQLS